MRNVKTHFRILLCVFYFTTLSLWAKSDDKDSPKYPDIAKKIEKATKISGFFTLYREDQNLYMVVPKAMLEKEFFMFTSLSKGTYGGMMLPHWTLAQQTLYFQQIGKSLLLFEKDTYHVADKGSPMSDAVDKTYLDSLKHSFRILAADKAENQYLINLNSYFFGAANTVIPSWYARYFGLQGVNPASSYWSMVKNFPNNTELEVRTTLSLAGMGRYYGESNQSFFYFSLVKKEKSDYSPRVADDRIGYFTEEKMDFSNQLVDGGKKRMIRRWNLQKSDPESSSSVVKKPIVFYLDKTIPYKYRQYVRSGILEWNKAFEKLGFIGAVEARLPGNEQTWDPSDVRYSTISWSAAEWGMAIGPSRTNPHTGEIIDADIIISSGWINVMDRQANFLGPEGSDPEPDKASGEVDRSFYRAKSQVSNPLEVFLDFENKYEQIRKKFVNHKVYFCDAHHQLASRRNFAIMSKKMAYKLDDKDFKEWKEKFIGAYLKELTMHEVGHTLGLRHNFKGSSVNAYKDLATKEWNLKNQVSSSVMDYNELYVAADPSKQGQYMNNSLGDYDYLAIEYGYKPFEKDENKELSKIAMSLREKNLEFCTDEDKWNGYDPHCETYDIGDDNVAFAKERIALAKRLLESAPQSLVTTGDRRVKLREVLSNVLMEYFRSSLKPLAYIGGIFTNRDHVKDPESKDSYIPVSYERHKAVLEFLNDYVFVDPLIKIPAELLASARTDAFSNDLNLPINPDLYFFALRKRSITTLMDPMVIKNLQNYAHISEKNMTVPELFEATYKMVFKKLLLMDQGKKAQLSSIDRQTHDFFVQGLKYHLSNPNYTAQIGTLSYHRHAARLLKNLLDRRIKALGTASSFKDATDIEHLRALRDEIESVEKAILIKL